MRIKRWTPIPDKPFVCGIMEGETDCYGITEEFYFFSLRLPSYGYLYDITRDEERWGQRVLVWHGKHGFKIFPRFIEACA